MLGKTISRFIIVNLALQSFLILPVQAEELIVDTGFNPNQILQDEDIFDVNGMTFDRLVNFLRAKGTLADYQTTDIDGVLKTAPEIIWRIAHTYKINPKYLLALLQKEQSLIEDPAPSQNQYDWATGFAVCDNCRKDDPDIQEFKGFASQLEWAAKQHREKYLFQLLVNGQTLAGKAPGKVINVDGEVIVPSNKATAMLYSYTPHLRGNLNLWKIWRRWFNLKFPDGSLVQAKNTGKIFLIRNGEKRAFASRSVMESLVEPAKAIQTSETELSSYPEGETIKFSKYALLRDSDGKIWLLTGKERRHIENMEAFRKFDFNEDEVEEAESSDLAEYPIGLKITTKTEFPQGMVMQDKTSRLYWYIENSIRHKLPDKVFLTLYFKGRTVKQTAAKKLESYEEGEPYQLHDGELVRSQNHPAVYIKENGYLRAIPSAEVFETMGWKWTNVVTVPDLVLKSYSVGDVFNLESIPNQTDAILAKL